MAFDYKKEMKQLYAPKAEPAIVTVPKAAFLAVRGEGDPNAEGGSYAHALNVLYAIAYTLKMSPKSGHAIPGYFEYVVPPLEGFWRTEKPGMPDLTDKSAFQWISVIRLPEFVTQAEFDWAVETASRKKQLDCSAAELLEIEEGLCVQMLHVGRYDDEPATVARMDAFAAAQGFVTDFSDTRLHHEIYLSDPRRTAPEKLKTVIRHPIRK